MIRKTANSNVAQSQTDSSLVTAVTGRRITVYRIEINPGATATTITFNSKGSGAGTAISQTYTVAANTPYIAYDPDGLFETNVGESLTCTTGAGSTVGVGIHYGLRYSS